MDYLTYIPHLLIPILASIFVRKRARGIKGFMLVIAISSVLMSSIAIAQVVIYNWTLEQKIAPLDRNGDGFWTPDEEATWSERDQKNLSGYMGDGGRNVFAAFVFPIFSILYSFVVTTVYWGVVAINRKIVNA
jgi:hypothetical protein